MPRIYEQPLMLVGVTLSAVAGAVGRCEERACRQRHAAGAKVEKTFDAFAGGRSVVEHAVLGPRCAPAGQLPPGAGGLADTVAVLVLVGEGAPAAVRPAPALGALAGRQSVRAGPAGFDGAVLGAAVAGHQASVLALLGVRQQVVAAGGDVDVFSRGVRKLDLEHGVPIALLHAYRPSAREPPRGIALPVDLARQAT